MSEETGGPSATACAECGITIHEGMDRRRTDDALFCRPCFDKLTAHVHEAIAAQSADINYPMGLIGGLAGGVLGALVWWGFTVVTNMAFGLVAIVIGIAVGKGITLLSGNKRHMNLQLMAVVITVGSFIYASFLVNRTFLLQALAEEGTPVEIPLLPNAEFFLEVLKAGFSPMDLIFLAIALWQAWKIPAPLGLQHGE